MTPGPDDVRDAAVGALDEANAAVGACLATGEASGTVADVLRTVQDALTEMAVLVEGRRDRSTALAGQLDRLRLVEPGSPTTSRPAPAGGSLAAGLLQLARTVVQRARRDLRRTSDGPVGECLDVLPPLLDALTRELVSAEESSVPVVL